MPRFALNGVLGVQQLSHDIFADAQSVRTKSRVQVEELKQGWLHDPCWDIEDTPGFDGYRTELYIYRLRVEQKQMQKELDNFRAFAKMSAEIVGQYLPQSTEV